MEKKRNLWVIPTDKPSRIGYHFDIVKEGRIDYAPNFGFPLFDKGRNFQHRPHNIYITSDEEIKEGDWYIIGDFTKIEDVRKAKKSFSKSEIIHNWYKKIILTTDQDLIADDIQAIDDEFLEWFVQNPSCEYFEIEQKTFGIWRLKDYEIKIPQEEPKQSVKEYENQGLEKYSHDLKKEKALELIEKFGDKSIDVVQEIILYITNGEPDYTGKTIWLQELQNEILLHFKD